MGIARLTSIREGSLQGHSTLHPSALYPGELQQRAWPDRREPEALQPNSIGLRTVKNVLQSASTVPCNNDPHHWFERCLDPHRRKRTLYCDPVCMNACVCVCTVIAYERVVAFNGKEALFSSQCPSIILNDGSGAFNLILNRCHV